MQIVDVGSEDEVEIIQPTGTGTVVIPEISLNLSDPAVYNTSTSDERPICNCGLCGVCMYQKLTKVTKHQDNYRMRKLKTFYRIWMEQKQGTRAGNSFAVR